MLFVRRDWTARVAGSDSPARCLALLGGLRRVERPVAPIPFADMEAGLVKGVGGRRLNGRYLRAS